MYDQAYFQQINAEEGPQAERLAKLLIWVYKPKSVLDIGCASGLYLKPYLETGVKVKGIDYSEEAMSESILQIPKQFIKILDITKHDIKLKADLTICIEVMEHIGEHHAKTCISRIVKTSDTIFFTAAQPGQGGTGHINCQPKDYWESLFNSEGFERKLEDEEYIKIVMGSGYHMGWLTNNLMVFKPRSLKKTVK